MKALRGGYTIVEVMIVLAITGIIFASSITIFSSRRAGTEFSQAVLDVQSELQSFSTQVATSSLPSSGTNQYCAIQNVSGREEAYLSGTDNSLSDCIYLGKALQVVPATNTIYIYPVLGLSTIFAGGVSTGTYPTTATQADPEPAMDGNGNALLTDTYYALNGATFSPSGTIKSAHLSSAPTAEEDFLAVYTNLQSPNASGSDTTAYVRCGNAACSAGSVTGDGTTGFIRKCVEEASGCGVATKILTNTSSWNLCLQDSSKTRKATVTLQASASGLTTSVTMDQCL